ncbi:MAG: branched-chain amino acid ABC transporter substrate-binding protein [Sulfuricella sp.]|nr:branched-chain amino acid ABC transporter substrate-binding protein [Sulfuricella sp.]
MRRLCGMAAALLLPLSALADITVAVVGPMSGEHASMGEQLRRGAQSAVEAINGGGGLLGQKLVLLVRDDLCDEKKAVAIAEELGKKGVALVDGHLCSGASIAASNIYRQYGVIQISPASTNPDFTDRNLPNVFRTCGRDDMQGFVASDYISRNHKNKKIAIVHDATVYSKGFSGIAKHNLNKVGIQEEFVAEIEKGQTEFAALLERIQREKVRFVLFASYGPEAAALLRQARAKGVKFRMLGGDTLMNKAFIDQAGRLADGVLITFPPDPSHDRRNQALTSKYLAQGYKPEAFTFYSYAALEIWGKAVAASNSTEMNTVSKTLKSEKFDSVLGKVGFDGRGDISAPGFVIYAFNRGEIDYLD